VLVGNGEAIGPANANPHQKNKQGMKKLTLPFSSH
jgi:hypothetical protein